MRFDFRTPKPEDLDKIDYKNVYSVGEVGCSKDLIVLSNLGRNNDCIATAFGFGDDIIGIAGSYRHWAGCSQLWAVFDKRVDRYPKELFKTCVVLINYAKQKQGLWRISLTVKSGYNSGERFAEALGFTLEGRMKKYLHDGSDAGLYAMVFP